MPADGIKLAAKKGTSARPAGAARRLGYIEGVTRRKGGMPVSGTAAQANPVTISAAGGAEMRRPKRWSGMTRLRHSLAASRDTLVSVGETGLIIISMGERVPKAMPGASMSEKKIKVLALQSPQIIINALAADFERLTGFGITQLRPGTSDINLFCYRESIIYLDPEISNRAFDLGVPEQELDCT